MIGTARFLLLSTLLFLNIIVLSSQTIQSRESQTAASKAQQRISKLLAQNQAQNQISLDSAILYGQAALAQAKDLGLDSLVAISHSYLSLTYYYRRQLDSLLFHAQAGGTIAQNTADASLQAYCLKMEALGHSYLGDFPSAMDRNEQALAIYELQQDTNRAAGIYANLGRLYQKQAVYNKALEYFIQAEQLFVRQQDTEGQSVTAAQIGDLLMDMEQPRQAIPYFQKALTLTDSVQSAIRYGDLLISLGVGFHTDSTMLDSAYQYFSQSRDLFARLGDQQGLAIANNNLGNVYRDQQNWEQAFLHLHRGFDIISRNKWQEEMAHSFKDLGVAHERRGQQDSAIHYYLSAYRISQEQELAFKEEAILKSLYLFYKRNDQPSQALHFYEQYIELLENTKSEALQKEIATLKTRYETEKKEQTIARLELESALQASSTRSYIFGFSALSLLLLLAIGTLYYRKRKDRQMYELQQTMLQQEKDKLDQEVQFKTKQLTSHALHMVQKNKVLQELRMGISDLGKDANAQQRKALRSLVRRIDFNIQADEDWETFRLYFEQTNQGFYTNLTKINSNLTSTELKLCSLIKLNLNIKETAAVLNIEPTSVKTARHRLRKKLNLQSGQDLTAFIRQVA